MSVARALLAAALLATACGQDQAQETETASDTEPALAASADLSKTQTVEDNLSRDNQSPVPGQGLHVSVSELDDIATLYRSGNSRIVPWVERLREEADTPWLFGETATRYEGTLGIPGISDKKCTQLDGSRQNDVLPNIGEQIYARVLAAHILQEDTYAAEAKTQLLAFAKTSGFNLVRGSETYTGTNQCALEISLLTPLLIESALLLAHHDSWTQKETYLLQTWLANHVYPVTSAIAGTRKNNWGSAAAFASWAIGYYLEGSGLSLSRSAPSAQTLSPKEARNQHVLDQLKIVGNDWRGDSRCEVFGAQVHGGFPDELRRGSTGCRGSYLQAQDAAYFYQIAHVGHLIYHAEALRRHGNNELFEYKVQDGSPMLLRAITFVTHNSTGMSLEWTSTEIGVVRVAAAYYRDPRLCHTVRSGFRFTESRYLPFTRLTYPDVCP